MNDFKKTILMLVTLLLILSTLNQGNAQTSKATENATYRWYKGNNHTHTLNSDGDSTPHDVVTWYREHGYHFLFITDHNFLTNVEGLNALHGADERFIVIKGVEVSDSFGDKPIHLNALNPEKLVLPTGGNSVVETIQKNVNAIHASGGLAQINHPNYRWAITPDDLKQVDHCLLLEIFNGHSWVNNWGGGGHPSTEEMWDEILSTGKLIYGVADDDAHSFKTPWDKSEALPGQGWIMVRAEKLTPESLIDAMKRGDFYASTGVVLEDYTVNAKSITINIKEQGQVRYRIQFIGAAGKTLQEAVSFPVTYEFKGDEGYVRAKIIDSNGHFAWTQPVMIK